MHADASQEAVLSRLLQSMVLRTAESVSSYAQTSDARHLLLPARQLIKVQNDDGDKLVVIGYIQSIWLHPINLVTSNQFGYIYPP